MSTEMNNPEPDLSEFADLVVALEAGRPEPTEEFTERLDTAVADHFPAGWSAESWGESRTGFFTPLKRLLANLNQHRSPLMAGAAGLAIVVVVVGIGMNQATSEPETTTIADSGAGGGKSNPGVSQSLRPRSASPEDASAGADKLSWDEIPTAKKPRKYVRSGITLGSGEVFGANDSSGRRTPNPVGPFAAGVGDRKVAHEAEITLGTKPENVQEVSNEIVDTVDDHNGIVLDSQVKDGPADEAGAAFSLMIPSTQLESAIGDLSGIADLRARNQETEDITAPTLTIEDSLQTSRARVESLVGELAAAGTDEERAEVEEELAQERSKVARLTTKLNRLDRRSNLTPVAVTVETGGDAASDDGDSAWGISDAIDDAGRALSAAAGVALIALAVAVPIAALVLIALALNRAWVRRARKRALDEN